MGQKTKEICEMWNVNVNVNATAIVLGSEVSELPN